MAVVTRDELVLGREELATERPTLAGADRRNDELFIARAALRRAIAMRESEDLQIAQLRALVARLAAERRAAI